MKVNKLDPILNDADIVAAVAQCKSRLTSDDLPAFSLGVAWAEQAILAKLAEQKPVMYARTYNGEIDWDEHCVAADSGTLFDCGSYHDENDEIPEGYAVMPLYAHPMPCPSNVSDKTACSPKTEESESQDLELLKQALETMISAAHPAYVQDDLLREKLIKARDIAFKALEANRLNAKERHRTTKNLTVDSTNITKLSLSVDTKEVQALLQSYLDGLDGWQLVPIEPTDSMRKAGVDLALNVSIGRFYTWDDYMRGIYNNMLAAAPKYTGGSDD